MDATVKKLPTRHQVEIGRGPAIVRPSREEAEEAVRTLIAYAATIPPARGCARRPSALSAPMTSFSRATTSADRRLVAHLRRGGRL